MIHTANLITKRDEYKYMDIMERKYIFNALYHFSRKIPIKYHSIFINKNYYNSKLKLRIEIIKQINLLIEKNYNYFNKFDKIVLYYDNGQDVLGNILDLYFSQFNNYTHIIDFDHTKKKLFQVADMLTFIDKYYYKEKHKIKITKNENYFLETFKIKKIYKEIEQKNLYNQKK